MFLFVTLKVPGVPPDIGWLGLMLGISLLLAFHALHPVAGSGTSICFCIVD